MCVFLRGNASVFVVVFGCICIPQRQSLQVCVCVYLFVRSNASVTGQCSVSVTLSLFLISWKLLLWVHENTAATEN